MSRRSTSARAVRTRGPRPCKIRTRSTVPTGSFGIDPADAEHLVATGADGLLESRDGDLRWSSSVGPRVLVVSWDERTGLWGAREDGTVYRHRTSVCAWDEKSSVEGEAQTLLGDRGAFTQRLLVPME